MFAAILHGHASAEDLILLMRCTLGLLQQCVVVETVPDPWFEVVVSCVSAFLPCLE